MFITPAEALTLPRVGNGYNQAKAIANSLKAGGLTPNLDDVNTRAGSIALTGAAFWLSGGKSDSALLAAAKKFILAAPGTNLNGTQALNPMRGIGGLCAAAGILKDAGVWDEAAICPKLGGQSFNTWLNGGGPGTSGGPNSLRDPLEFRVLGTGNSRWPSISFTAHDSANNWGSVARYALVTIAALRGDVPLMTTATDLFKRFLGDNTKAQSFRPSGGYIKSWDNTGSFAGKLNNGIGVLDLVHPGVDGVVVDDVNRGGTGYSATSPYFGARTGGLTYPLEAAEYIWATASMLKHEGVDVATLSGSALLRMGDWFYRARNGSTTAYTHAEAAYTIYRNHRWLGNHWRGNSSFYGLPVATGSGVGAMLRSMPDASWLCGAPSQWLR